MLILITVALSAIALVAWLKPDWTKNVYETTLAWLAVGAAGVIPIIMDVFNYFVADTTWTEAIGEGYRPIALVMIALLGILIRHLNTGPKKKK